MPFPVGSVSQYNLRNSNNYALPNCRLEITKKSFFPSTTRDWNNLSPEIRNSGIINIFKIKNKILLVNLKPSPACICGHGFEDCMHFFFECPFL